MRPSLGQAASSTLVVSSLGRVRPHPQGALWYLTQPSPEPPGAVSQTGALLSNASAEWIPPAVQGQSHFASASPACCQAQCGFQLNIQIKCQLNYVIASDYSFTFART